MMLVWGMSWMDVGFYGLSAFMFVGLSYVLMRVCFGLNVRRNVEDWVVGNYRVDDPILWVGAGSHCVSGCGRFRYERNDKHFKSVIDPGWRLKVCGFDLDGSPVWMSLRVYDDLRDLLGFTNDPEAMNDLLLSGPVFEALCDVRGSIYPVALGV